jgi:hypothetical protein
VRLAVSGGLQASLSRESHSARLTLEMRNGAHPFGKTRSRYQRR